MWRIAPTGYLALQISGWLEFELQKVKQLQKGTGLLNDAFSNIDSFSSVDLEENDEHKEIKSMC